MASEIKALMLQEYVDEASSAQGLILTEMGSLSVGQNNAFRRELEKTSASCKVVKNRVAKRMLEACDIEGLDMHLKGQTMIVFPKEDLVKTVKVIVSFEKEVESFRIKAGYWEKKSLNDTEVKVLATLPPREQLIAQVLMLMQSPITGTVSALQGILRKFVYVLRAIQEKQENE